MSICPVRSARNAGVNATTAPPMLPGFLSARRLLQMGCAETIVLRVLVTDVGLTAEEASSAIDAAHASVVAA
jgi:hypothetical protein